MGRKLLALVLVLVVAGCNQEGSSPTTPAPTKIIPTETAVKADLEAAEPTPVVDSPRSGTVEATATTVAETKTDAPTPTAVETRIEETSENNQGQAQEGTVVFNGIYGDSYFRGAETAPVTILDYSDFL